MSCVIRLSMVVERKFMKYFTFQRSILSLCGVVASSLIIEERKDPIEWKESR
jgi:hypothetical protein